MAKSARETSKHAGQAQDGYVPIEAAHQPDAAHAGGGWPRRISIAMATYNGERYLQAQLESIIAQTLLPNELVVSDDGSTDATLAILETFANHAPFPVIMIRNEQRLGYGQNFNRALMQTTGDLIFLCDQDDVWFPEKIARLTEVARGEPNTSLLIHDGAITDARLSPSGATIASQHRGRGHTDDSYTHGCCVAVKRDFLNLCLPIPEGYPAHDTWLVRVATALARKRLLPDVLLYYRRHDSAVTDASVTKLTRLTRWWWRSGQLRARWRGRLQRLRKLPASIKADVATEELNQMRLMRMWAEGTATGALADDRSALLALSESLQRREEVLCERQRIWSEAIWRRGTRVARLWRNGDYALYAGWRSVIRDLLT